MRTRQFRESVVMNLFNDDGSNAGESSNCNANTAGFHYLEHLHLAERKTDAYKDMMSVYKAKQTKGDLVFLPSVSQHPSTLC
ncbi:hypothetical protein TNCV_3440511 [Trichonephila clavipes]|uniref:Uncharacterized protein n=1 Tax=Trichonephila clavipes TaxID=2585209 RepID=A0A8X7BFH9_TRICX|nr:hypothetical protein TNCV_3440511 [Trichonephila clavipes]